MRLAEATAPKFGDILLEDMVARVSLAEARNVIALLDVSPDLHGRLDRHTGELLRSALEIRFGIAVRDHAPMGKASAEATQGSPESAPTTRPAKQPAMAKRLGFGGKAWIVIEATLRTVFATLFKPLAYSLGIAMSVWVALLSLFERAELSRAIADGNPWLFASDPVFKWAAAAGAIGIAIMAMLGLSTFLFSTRTFLKRNLGKHLPRDEALLGLVPIQTLRFYHNVLRCAGAVAFASEFVLQMLAASVVAWTVTLFLPFPIFNGQAGPSFMEVQLFWLNQVFLIIDGPNTFGISFSSLEADRSLWPFGIAILTFRFLVIGLIVRLFWDALTLQPRDISHAWGAALERGA